MCRTASSATYKLIEVITHLAFYAGWPAASTAVTIARRVFEESEAG